MAKATSSPEPTPEVDPEAVAAEGYYAVAESDDNAIDTSNDAYVGVSPEYKTHADDSQKPLFSEDDDLRAQEELSVQYEKDRQTEVGMHGYTSDVAHPSEATPNVGAFNVAEPAKGSDAGEAPTGDAEDGKADSAPSASTPSGITGSGD